MNEVPPEQEGPDDVDDLYRRASALDEGRPSELVRRRVLSHAAQLAAERTASSRAAHRTWRRPAVFGTLAAAALAGLLVTPLFFTRVAPPGLPPAPAPASLPASESHLQEAPAPPAPAQRTDRKSAPRAEAAAQNSPAEMPNLANARSKAAASDATQAGAPARPVAPLAAAVRASDPAAELRRAAESGEISELQMLLGGQAPIEARDENGRTALMLAALRGQARAVEVLLAHGADPNAADADGSTPLQAAVAGHQQAIVAALQRAGAR